MVARHYPPRARYLVLSLAILSRQCAIPNSDRTAEDDVTCPDCLHPALRIEPVQFA